MHFASLHVLLCTCACDPQKCRLQPAVSVSHIGKKLNLKRKTKKAKKERVDGPKIVGDRSKDIIFLAAKTLVR